jgi:hypothetical protein
LSGLEQALRIFAGAGCRTVLLNGSFVSVKVLPQDYDAAAKDAALVVRRCLTRSCWIPQQVAAMKLKYGGSSPCDDGHSGRSLSRLFQRDKNAS